MGHRLGEIMSSPYRVEGYKTVPKTWGYELHIVNNNMYCGKILHIDKGKKLSLHWHEVKTETFFILHNAVEITYYWSDIQSIKNLEDQLFTWQDLERAINRENTIVNRDILIKNNVFHINQGMRHSVKAINDDYAEILEISTHDDPEDSIRILQSNGI